MMELDPDPLSPYSNLTASDVKQAASLLSDRKVIVYPTETLYGFFAPALDDEALGMIATLKGRLPKNPLPCIIGRRQDLSKLVQTIVPDQELLINRFWPGPLTLVFDGIMGLPSLLTGGTNSVGVRLPGYGPARRLAEMVGPLVATSANRSGEPTPCDPAAIKAQFPNVPLFDGGILQESKGSTVLDARTGPATLIRDGAICASALSEALQTPIKRGEV